MANLTAAPALVETLATRIRGEVIAPDHPGYDDARAVYNGGINKRPMAIARCTDRADVAAAVCFAESHELEIAIRGGGHNGAGLATTEGGLVIDLSRMRSTRVDAEARTVEVGGGCTAGHIDEATHAFGLATPLGIVSTTGIGLILGGGVGYLTRKYGLSIDNVVSAEVVLADGRAVTANEHQHEDLFWALRGGGGNFGVVTALTLRLHEQASIVGGPMLWQLDQAADVLSWYRDFISEQQHDVNGFFTFVTVPPAPPFPEALHMKKMCGVMWCLTGGSREATAMLAPVRRLDPIYDGVVEMPVPALQSAFDPLYPAGDQWYWRGDFVATIPDAAIDAHLEFANRLPTWKSTMHLYPVDGAAALVSNDATPWAHRDAKWAAVYVGVDPDAANADLIMRWAVEYSDALRPYSMGGSYVNFMMDEGQGRVQATYGANLQRLAEIKAKYDRDNMFHVNQNIVPARARRAAASVPSAGLGIREGAEAS